MLKKKQALPTKFTMEFEPTTIEHLGLKLYSSLPPVIGELVSNSWDADATKVEITIPQGAINTSSIVTIKDNGTGMNPDDMQSKYLFIGRNRREAESRDLSVGKRRPVTGRKGLGKLAVFGIADRLEIRTVSGGFAVTLLLDYQKMREWPRGKPYEPEIVESKCGRTSDADGTTVTISSLRRKMPIVDAYISSELVRRFRFIGKDFRVSINGSPIKASERRSKKDCRAAWDVAALNVGDVVDQANGWKVTGWIGIVEKSSQTDRGVDIFARDKAVELDTMFNLKTTHAQFARAYVVGEVSAEFLDADEDRIATARNSVNWETEAGLRLQEWGEKALKDVFDRWLQMQKKEKEQKIIKTGNFDEWLASRTTREQRIARRLLKVIIDDPDIEPASAAPLLEIIKSNVEFQAFQDLVDEIEDSGTSVTTLLKLFRDWRVIEAREYLKLSDGRLEAMEKLSGYIDTGALEVQEIQPLFENNPWLIDPTWGAVSGQETYTKMLRAQFPESTSTLDEDRRLDLLGIRVSSELNIVELKRPKKTLTRSNLEQIEAYVDWARSKLLGTGPDAPKFVRGLLVVGALSSKGEIQQKMTRLAGSEIRVETFGDLLIRARKVYGELQSSLKSIAPEYTKEARRQRLKPGKKNASKSGAKKAIKKIMSKKKKQRR